MDAAKPKRPDERADRWQDVRVRPGALFLVGDPKQAIYRFRGADIRAYMEARKTMEAQPGGKVIQVTANFRSRKGVLDHVNDCFDPVLSSASQPGYVKLTHTIEDPDDAHPAVAKVTINLPPDPNSETQREAEAEAVARSEEDFGMLAQSRDWELKTPDPAQWVWTDDYSNIVGAVLRKLKE